MPTSIRLSSRLSLLDSLLPLWILLAMALGILLGAYSPAAKDALSAGSIADVSLPLFIGLCWMMYPVLCKVKYETLWQKLNDRQSVRIIAMSLLMNIVLAPLLMTGLAWLTLPDLPHERTGIILVGVARCIAMVMIWNQLADGDTEWCAILVAINSLSQLALYGPVAYFLTHVVGGDQSPSRMVDMWLVVRSVLVFLGIPLAAGFGTRCLLRPWRGAKWYDTVFLPIIGPTSLLGLLFTIVVMFTLQGNQIIRNIPTVLRTTVPLLLYFVIVFISTLVFCLYTGQLSYSLAVTQAFTAAGNNFELAIAVAAATYGIDSKEAFAAVIGPLIEVPVLLGLAYVALWFRGVFEGRRNKSRFSGGRDSDDGRMRDVNEHGQDVTVIDQSEIDTGVAGCHDASIELETTPREDVLFLTSRV